MDIIHQQLILNQVYRPAKTSCKKRKKNKLFKGDCSLHKRPMTKKKIRIKQSKLKELEIFAKMKEKKQQQRQKIALKNANQTKALELAANPSTAATTTRKWQQQ